jgi:tetratricopeptide (TPR) repeat protein
VAFKQALRADSDSDEALAALVRLSLATKDHAAALDYLRRYSLAIGDDPDGLARAANWHLQLARYEDALELATKAAEPKVLGLVALHRGAPESALVQLEKAPLDAAVIEGLIQAHIALGQLGKAAARARQIGNDIEASPELKQLSERVASLIDRRKQIQDHATVAAGKEEDALLAADHFVCAEFLWQQTNPTSEVERVLKGAFPEGVEVGEAYALRGLLLLERGRLTKALADAEKALALCPQDPRGSYVRGRIRLERGAKGALEDLIQATKGTERKDAAILHWLACAQEQAGHPSEALATEREAVTLKPRDLEIQEQLRELEKIEKGRNPAR